jgi:hypothetical protein
MPYYCLAILLVYALAVALPIFPPGGGYAYGRTPALTLPFIGDVLLHYALPFFSLVAIFVGTQAVGMRSMAIYELGSDYVTYARGLGVSDNRSMLDASLRATILNLLLDLRASHRMAVIFITHDLGQATYLSDRILVMYRGEIVEQGPAEQVRRAPRHEYTQRLLADVPRLKGGRTTHAG